MLEAGSGAGRFTEILAASGADVFTFDYSSAVDANARNNETSSNVHFFQGDIFSIPLTEASFDKVICLGVLQHTRPILRLHFGVLTKYVKPGGLLAVDVYRRDLAALFHWKYLLRPITKRVPKERLYHLHPDVHAAAGSDREAVAAHRWSHGRAPRPDCRVLTPRPAAHAECAVGRPRHVRHVFASPRPPAVPRHRKSMVPGCRIRRHSCTARPQRRCRIRAPSAWNGRSVARVSWGCVMHS